MRSSRPCLRRNALWVSLVALFAFAATARAGQPTANFTWAPASPTSGNEEVSFTDQSTGHPTSWLWDFGDSTAGALNTSTAQNPLFIYNLPGNYTVTLTVSNNDGQSTTTHVLAVLGGTPPPPRCQSDDATMCLNRGRFAVSAIWIKPDGTTGSGHAVGLTGDSGYFWFFDEANIELVVKVLDGCGITNSYWVFAAGLTNVSVQLYVTDTTRDNYNVYQVTNPQGVAFVPIQDTGAFLSAFCP
jgi:PKD repeat protein